jgi:hypothetical protein
LNFLHNKPLTESIALGSSKKISAEGSSKGKGKAPLTSSEEEAYMTPNVPQDPLTLTIMKSQVFTPLNHNGHNYACLGPYEPL